MEDEGLCRAGWSTQAASLDLSKNGGAERRRHRNEVAQSTFDDYGTKYGKEIDVACWLDLDVEGGSCGFDVNGKSFGNAFAPFHSFTARGHSLVYQRGTRIGGSFSELKFPKEGLARSTCPSCGGLSDQNQYEPQKSARNPEERLRHHPRTGARPGGADPRLH